MGFCGSVCGRRGMIRSRGQLSMEYVMVVAITSIVLALLLLTVLSIQRRSAEAAGVVQARNAVEQLASATDLVAVQGSPARKTIQVYVPRGIVPDGSFIGSRTAVTGRIINIRVTTPYGEEDVWSYTSATVNGSLPDASGSTRLAVQHNGDHIAIGPVAEVPVP